MAVLGALLLTSVALVGLQAAPPASAAVTAQCDGVFNVGGEGMSCEITVENVLDLATGVASSTVTTLSCSGAANVDPLPTCVGPTVTEYEELTTSANQCNGSANGGGSSMICSVTVVNTITGNATTSIAPVNQCVGSLTTGDVRACNPDPATTDASVDGITQCNGSVNGGGGSMTCTVSTTSTSNSAFDFLVNQCNDSANGGGALIECFVDISTVIVPAAVVEPEPEAPITPEAPVTPEAPPVVAAPPTEPTLPATGPEAFGLAGAAALLMALGVLGVISARRTTRIRP